MAGEKTIRHLLQPEARAWMRSCDGLAVPGCAFAAAIMYFVFAPPFENKMLHFCFYIAMIGGGVFAWTLYRESDLNRLERLAMMAMPPGLVFVLIRATAANGWQS